jgi:F0F1-type ATP synthase beta subunit
MRQDILPMYMNVMERCISPYTNVLVFAAELNHIAEIAFYMVGPINEMHAKADQLAKEQM